MMFLGADPKLRAARESVRDAKREAWSRRKIHRARTRATRQIENSKRLLWALAVYWLVGMTAALAFAWARGFEPTQFIISNTVVMTSGVLGYFTYQAALKNSRNKYHVTLPDEHKSGEEEVV
jgi:hypothetical protein